MSESSLPPWVDDPILELSVEVRPTGGERVPVRIVFHRPRPFTPRPGDDSACGVEFFGMTATSLIEVGSHEQCSIAGVDDWQAFNLAKQFAKGRLEHAVDLGATVYWCDEPVEVNGLFEGRMS